MKNLKVVDQQSLKDWAKEIFQKNSFNMVDVSSKKETFRRALASGKIYVGKDVFELIKNKEMPKGDPITLAEVSAVLGVKKTSELIPLCHPLQIDHTATKIIMNEGDNSLEVFCVVSAVMFHSNFSEQNEMINFLKNIAIAGGFLFLVAHGAGKFALDNR